MLTQKDYCDYDTCVALKELGYDELCEGYYHITDDEDYNQLSFEWCCGCDFQNSLNRWRVGAPTLYEAQKWLREEKSILILPDYNIFGWFCGIHYPINSAKKYIAKEVNSYEEVLLEGIKEAVKLLKEEK